MSVIWRKVWRDLARNKTRTLLVVLSTAVGVFALGLVFGLSGLLSARMTEDYRASNPAHITFGGGIFDREAVEAVREESGIVDAEAETFTTFRWRLEGETDWRDGSLIARSEYETQRMNQIDLVAGAWPDPAERTLMLERQSSRYFDIPLDATIVVEFGRSERRLPVEGVVRSARVFPPQLGGDATFYATPETVAWLTGVNVANRLSVRLETFSKDSANVVADEIERRLDRMGRPVGGYFVSDPSLHPMQDTLNTVSLILLVLGALALGLGAFLIINTLNAIVAQQVWQIGVMKVLGATFGRVMRVYLTTALIYGLLACLIAVPLAAAGAHLIAGWLLDLMNIDSGPFQVMPVVAGIQILVGLIVPVLAALIPVIGGARITPHQAISNYGLGAGFGRGWLDRIIGRIRSLPRPLALSLRNTFRRKARVALTLLTLVLGGVMFIVVMSVGTSLDNTLEMLIQEFGFDVWVSFDRPYRTVQLTEIAEEVPGVAAAEVWDYRGANLALSNGEEREVFVWGVPPESMLFDPRVVSGRALLPEDGHAILLNNKIATDEGIQVGDEIQLSLDGRESTWQVVGLVFNVNNDQRDSFVPFRTVTRETGNVDRGSVVMVMAEEQGRENERALMGSLRDTFEARGIEPSSLQGISRIRQQNQSTFNIIIYLMLAMALLAAVVGSIGLMGTMSINVVERSREIGVMRAIGATSFAIGRIVISEGMLLGVLSWLIALPISYPGAQSFSRLIGETLVNVPLDFSYSVGGLIIWLTLVIVLSALASLWPARRATGVSVREVLVYE